MKSNNTPKKHPVPFGQNGNKNDIPETSTQGSGLASLREGFPPLTMTPKVAGGIPPSGKDFNGILNELSAQGRWNSAGAGYPFDQAFANAIGGYPAGAKIPRSDLSGFWLNTLDDNTQSPEVNDGSVTGWIPADNLGITELTGLAKENITLTTLQAAKETLVLSGILTNNVSVYFPAWSKSWNIVNNCTGNGEVTCRLVGEVTGVKIEKSSSRAIFYNGTDIAYLTPDSSTSNHGLAILSSATDSDEETVAATSKAVKSAYDLANKMRVARFESSGTFTVPDRISTLYITACGGGGGGGGGGGSEEGSYGGSGAGGGAGQSVVKMPVKVTPLQAYNLEIGKAGKGGAGGDSTGVDGISGTDGGKTQFGTLLILDGGMGGGFGGGSKGSGVGGAGSAYGGGYGSDGGVRGGSGGMGGSCPLGTAGGNGRSGNTDGKSGTKGYGFGAGGGGGGAGYGRASNGGHGSDGMPGLIILEW